MDSSDKCSIPHRDTVAGEANCKVTRTTSDVLYNHVDHQDPKHDTMKCSRNNGKLCAQALEISMYLRASYDTRI